MMGWPLGSTVLGMGDDGLPEYSNTYVSETLRGIIKSLVSQGVFGQDAMSVSIKPRAGYTLANSPDVTVDIAPGMCSVDGGLAKTDGETIGEVYPPQVTSSKQHAEQVTYVIVRLSKGGDESVSPVLVQGEETTQATTEDVPILRGEQAYDICIAKVKTVSDYANGSVTNSYTLTDTRLDDDLCGIATAFVDIDTTQFYELMNDMISQLESATNTAVELANAAIDGTVAIQLSGRISTLEDRFDDNGDILPSSIANGTITSEMMQENSVGEGELANGSVTIDKLSQDVRELISNGSDVWKQVYPVGSIYISYNSTSPQQLFGGSWTQITGRYLRAANDNNVGGNNTVSHSHQYGMEYGELYGAIEYKELPAAIDGLNSWSRGSVTKLADKNGAVNYATQVNGVDTVVTRHRTISNTASSSISIMPSYQDVYVWRRTA